MLGKIRNAVSDQVKRRILAEQDKDFTQLSDGELADRLAKLTEQTASGG